MQALVPPVSEKNPGRREQWYQYLSDKPAGFLRSETRAHKIDETRGA